MTVDSGVYEALFSSLFQFSRPHAFVGRALPGELGLLAQVLLDSDEGREGRARATKCLPSPYTASDSLCLRFLIV